VQRGLAAGDAEREPVRGADGGIEVVDADLRLGDKGQREGEEGGEEPGQLTLHGCLAYGNGERRGDVQCGGR
jgi:hypothetical protein